jgi:transposase
MRAYSGDLRERVIAAWQAGRTQAWIAETYQVSTGSIKRYIRRYQAVGTVEATVQRRQAPRISAHYEEALRQMVATKNTARLDEYCTEWQQQTGMQVSIQTMSRMLVRLGLRQKNDGTRG